MFITTVVTKGIAKGLNISQMIKSPTYTIVREYEGRLPLYHLDAHWEVIPKIIALRDQIAPKTLITINGDIPDRLVPIINRVC